MLLSIGTLVSSAYTIKLVVAAGSLVSDDEPTYAITRLGMQQRFSFERPEA
jgi:hypothetical protein